MLRIARQQIAAQLLYVLIGKDPSRRLTPEQIARLEKIWGRRGEEMAKLEQTAETLHEMAKTLREADVATIRSRLREDNSSVRRLLIQTIAQRRLPLEADLIDLLGDPNTRSAAHDALTRLARGTDFGPIPGASQRGIERSIDKWKQWLTLQQCASPEKQAKIPPLEIVPLVLVGEERSQPPPKAAKLHKDGKK